MHSFKFQDLSCYSEVQIEIRKSNSLVLFNHELKENSLKKLRQGNFFWPELSLVALAFTLVKQPLVVVDQIMWAFSHFCEMFLMKRPVGHILIILD